MTALKGASNVTVTYNSNALTAHVNTVQLDNVIAELESTHLGSTASESDPGLAKHTLDIGGDWNSTIDGYLGPDGMSGTKRTCVIVFGPSGSQVTYTWTSQAFITNWQIQSPANGKQTWTAKLNLSGAGARS